MLRCILLGEKKTKILSKKRERITEVRAEQSLHSSRNLLPRPQWMGLAGMFANHGLLLAEAKKV